ncbi:hypothetical protein [Turneriella parva]|uniref:Outer membrane protein beta-barrel domain-containing protein n=1 Tax=Turneriella parva (strain ATCC BAA-1111 / DSM 21527 / NCTC 11395 / H) TaxID=869212 RepID=I4B3C0_TURPD|nr:hypothetical protein [Turneriella parva]AFM11777.1 hypothetical protein Turpa_1129 [Turneriella parva DSM 21527]
MKLLRVLAVIVVTTTAASAGLEFGADASYFNPRLTARTYPSLATTQTTAFAGPLFTGYAHLTFGIPQTLLIGFGPSLGYAAQSTSDPAPGETKDEMTIARFGLDAKVQLEVLQVIMPYVRLTIGKDTISFKDTGTTGSGTYIASSTAGGIFYNALVGFQIPFAADFALYFQGGFTASPGSALVTRSYAVNGVNQPVSSPGASDTSYAGYLLSAGARLSF